MPTRMTILVIALCLSTGSCSRDGKKALTEPKEIVMYTLTVSLGEGVSGAPNPGIYKYRAGTSVSYSFAAKQGYRNVIAELDNQMVQKTGSVTLNSNLRLFAVAELTPVVPEEAKPIKEDVVQYMTATSPETVIKSYEKYLVNLDELYTLNPTKARTLALAAQKKAFEETPDSIRERSEDLLSGKLFGPRDAVPTSISSLSGATTPKVSIIFVNGILNPIDGAEISRKEIEKIVAEAGLSEKVNVYNFYNSSARFDQTNEIRCFVRAILLGSYQDLSECGAYADFEELNRQVANILNKDKSNVEKEAKALVDILKEERSEGHAVILIGHSQGTLMASQANAESGIANGCISGISLAGILGRDSWLPLANPNLDGFVIAGERASDIVLVRGSNDFAKISTNLAREADTRLVEIDRVAGKYISAAARIFENVQLHSMTGSYTAGIESRTLLRNLIMKQFDALQKKPECSVASGPRIFASSGSITNDAISAPSDLWAVTVAEKGVDEKIGRIKSVSGEDLLITDISRSPDGYLFAITRDALYVVDTLTAQAELITRFTANPAPELNALAINSRGRLYATSVEGRTISMDPPYVDVLWNGDLGSLYRSSGDLAFSPEGRLYATVTTNIGFDRLAELSTEDGHVTRLYEPIGSVNVWGLNFVGNKLYGLTSDSGNGSGSLISIDLETGKGALVRKLSFDAFGAGARRKY